MYRKLTVTSGNGLSMEIGRSKPYILQVLDGTGIPSSDTETLKSPNQDGSSYVQTLLNEREIEVEMAILENEFPDLFTLKESVCAILNPKYRLTVLYEYPGGSKEIIGHLSSEVIFTRGGMRGYQKAAFTIECSDPMWTDDDDTGVVLAVSAPTFYFPLVFDPEITFSEAQNKTVTINNNGHVATPITIQFFGPSENPIITNETTGEFIKVNKTLAAGEVMIITTGFGQKSVTIDGVNSFGFIDPASTFFDLEPGDNVITYDADSGADSAEVIITYRNRFTGV